MAGVVVVPVEVGWGDITITSAGMLPLVSVAPGKAASLFAEVAVSVFSFMGLVVADERLNPMKTAVITKALIRSRAAKTLRR